MLLTTVTLLAGFGVGWIACHYLVVRHLIWTVRDMRKAGFVFDPPRDPSAGTTHYPTVNED